MLQSMGCKEWDTTERLSNKKAQEGWATCLGSRGQCIAQLRMKSWTLSPGVLTALYLVTLPL